MSHAGTIGFHGPFLGQGTGRILVARALANCTGPAFTGEEALRCLPRKTGQWPVEYLMTS